MKPKFLICIFFTMISVALFAEDGFRVRGLCVAAPAKEDVDEFVMLIDKELAPAGVNTLILRVDFGFRYKTHPELVGENPLETGDVKKMVDICKKHQIKIIPQVNLLGHQSWSVKIGKLLEVYPEFDETPGIALPAEYKWPNSDGLYCKSYCPLHPGVHQVVFDVVDEIVDVFEADAFHAGMDEVFYIAHPDCPRCQGLDPAVLFAGEVSAINHHLKQNRKALWIWGDRLIDGKTTGVGLWEGSYNNTHRAIDLIPKEVIICDWHYDIAHPTPVLFASKGFQVVACPWNKSQVAVAQVTLMQTLKSNSSKAMKERYAGMVHTYWGGARGFIDGMLGKTEKDQKDPSVATFKALKQIW